MTIDVRTSPTVISPVVINCEAVQFVQQYKYLGTVINGKLSFMLMLCVKKPIRACIFIVNLKF